MPTIDNNKKRIKNDNWGGNIRERSDGRWESRIMMDGTTKSFYGKTPADVKKKMRLYRSNMSNDIGDKKTSLQMYIANYLMVYKLGVVKESTYDRYESTFLHHIHNSPLGKKALGSINDVDVIKHIKSKIRPTTSSQLPLSKSSVKKILELLRLVFKHALMKGKISSDPTVDIRLPNEDIFIIKTKSAECLEDMQMQKIKIVSEQKRKNGKPLYRSSYIIMILLNTGLRCGEMLALTWNDIDFDNNLMYVNQSVMANVKIRDDEGKPVKRMNKLSSTKTSNGKRIIPLNQQCIFYLNQLKAERNTLGISTDYVAYSNTGTRITARNLQRSFDLILAKADLPHYNLHILRHSFGSKLIRSGVDVTVVSKLLGHSNITITYNKYIHVIQAQQNRAIALANVI